MRKLQAESQQATEKLGELQDKFDQQQQTERKMQLEVDQLRQRLASAQACVDEKDASLLKAEARLQELGNGLQAQIKTTGQRNEEMELEVVRMKAEVDAKIGEVREATQKANELHAKNDLLTEELSQAKKHVQLESQQLHQSQVLACWNAPVCTSCKHVDGR